jgi:hypothetical protein
VVLRTGFEPAIFAVRGRCPKPLDDRSRWSHKIPGSAHGYKGAPINVAAESVQGASLAKKDAAIGTDPQLEFPAHRLKKPCSCQGNLV